MSRPTSRLRRASRASLIIARRATVLGLCTWLITLTLWTGAGAALRSPATEWALKQIGNITDIAFLPTRAATILLGVVSQDPIANSGALRSVLLYHIVGWSVALTAMQLSAKALAHAWNPRTEPISPARRRFLRAAAVGGGAVAGSGGIVGCYATLIEPSMLRVTRHHVPIRDLPPELDGLRIAQISDTHFGRRVTAAHIAGAVRAAIDLKPDVFVLTGDYVSGEPALHTAATDLFLPIRDTGKPVFSVRGNHDWFHDGEDMGRHLHERSLGLIDNDRAFLDRHRRQTTRPSEAALVIAGVGDLTMHTVDFRAALAGIPDSLPRILLSHQPDVAEIDARHRIDLMLAGHTHGGQVRLPGLGSPIVPSRYGDRYAYGLIPGPRYPVVITSGVGLSILPIRLGMPPEIVEVTLVIA